MIVPQGQRRPPYSHYVRGRTALAGQARTRARARGRTKWLQGWEPALVCGGSLIGQYSGRSWSRRRRHFERLLEGTGGRSGGLLDHSISGSVYHVLHWGRNDLRFRVGTPESGGDWSITIVSIKGRVVFATVCTSGREGRTTVKSRLKVAASSAGGV